MQSDSLAGSARGRTSREDGSAEARQFLYVLAGEATLEAGGGHLRALGPHEGLEVPPGVPHQMQN